jgi:hypothetical protein
MVRKADQHTSSFALAFQRAKDEMQPIGVVAGKLQVADSLRLLSVGANISVNRSG